jgi:hypothetical protein
MRLSPFSLRFNKRCMSGESRKKPAPGGGEFLLTLPSHLRFLILGRIPILELRRLLKGKVSPHFSAAIRAVFKEIFMECLKAILDADKTRNHDTHAFKQSYKAEYLLKDVASWRMEQAYSAPDCCWRDAPLSAIQPEEAGSGWSYGDADPCTWIEGGRRFQVGIPRNPWEAWSVLEDSEGSQESEH